MKQFKEAFQKISLSSFKKDESEDENKKNKNDYYSIDEAQGNRNAAFRLVDREFAYSGSSVCGKRKKDEDASILVDGLSIENPQEYLHQRILKMNSANKRKKSGTTASLYYLDPKKEEITVANLGDSRVYFTIEYEGEYKTILLTQDHNLVFIEMQERARNNKATIGDYGDGVARVLGKDMGMNMSHCIGNCDIKGIIRKPDTNTFNIDSDLVNAAFPGAKMEDCNFTITNACDGLTDHAGDANYDLGATYDENGKFLKFTDPAMFVEVCDEVSNPSGFVSQGFVNRERSLNNDNENKYKYKIIRQTGMYKEVLFGDYKLCTKYNERKEFIGFELKDSALKKEGWSLSTYKGFIKSKLSDVVKNFLTDDAQNLAGRMVNNALSEKSEDNITVTTCHFSGKSLKEKTAGICGGIFDGHGKHGRLISRRCMKILSMDLKKEQKLCRKRNTPSTTPTITSSENHRQVVCHIKGRDL